MAQRSTAGFVREAFDLLARHDPERFGTVAGRVGRAGARYRVGRERFTVTARFGEVVVREGWRRGGPRTLVEADATAILDLVDGGTTVEALLASARISMVGSVDRLLELSAAVRTFAAAAMGSPALQQHFERYRGWVIADGGARAAGR